MPVHLHQGDCLEVLRTLPDQSVDSIVTDPPYGISFMSRKWDYDVPGVAVWIEALRVLKPGGHLLCFASTRTYHRMVVAIEDAGFEIRDQIGWVYGSGFPKSHDVSKAIDKALGAERPVVGSKVGLPGYSLKENDTSDHGRKAYGQFTNAEAECAITAPGTEEAARWKGWGTALKPAWEPVCVARKPLGGTVAENVLAHGTGAINIDGCRVPVSGDDDIFAKNPHTKGGFGHGDAAIYGDSDGAETYNPSQGRFPANLIHDGSAEVIERFPHTASGTGTVRRQSGADEQGNTSSAFGAESRAAGTAMVSYGDAGNASRFFYCAKASKKDRCGSKHPTVKPIALMRYLVRLVTPAEGVVLDPFAGSGTTGQAAIDEGFDAVLIEREAEYCVDIRRRLFGYLVEGASESG